MKARGLPQSAGATGMEDKAQPGIAPDKSERAAARRTWDERRFDSAPLHQYELKHRKCMRVNDFETAISALGVSGLEITEMKMSATAGGQVSCVYGKIGDLTYLLWDCCGRGFRFSINPNVEGCVVVSQYELLDYRRDKQFDLKFE